MAQLTELPLRNDELEQMLNSVSTDLLSEASNELFGPITPPIGPTPQSPPPLPAQISLVAPMTVDNVDNDNLQNQMTSRYNLSNDISITIRGSSSVRTHFINTLNSAYMYLTDYKNLLEQRIQMAETIEDKVIVAMRLYECYKDVDGVDRPDILEPFADEDGDLDAMAFLAKYYWVTKDYNKCMKYMLRMADMGCDTHCYIPFDIMTCIDNDYDTKVIEKYYKTLYENNKSNDVYNYLLIYKTEIGDYEGARQLFQEMKELEYPPYDLYVPLINHLVYEEDNPFPKDDITNTYMNKLNNPMFNMIGKCPVCLEDDTLLIPFNCTHFACAGTCYPKIVTDENMGCPECRMQT